MKTSYRFLALGDSYTIGEGVEEKERWPNQLAVKFREIGTNLGDPQIIAQTGWTAAELLRGMGKANPKGPYSLVSVLIGVNNQVRGLKVESYRKELVKVLTRAVKLAGGKADRVFVLSIPDWGVTPFAQGQDQASISNEIDQFNAATKEEATRLRIPFIDITDISRDATHDPGLITSDGLHPSGRMYERWVERAGPTVLGILRKN